MASLDELAGRVAALEERLGVESGLRASMDGDLSSINAKLAAQHHLIQALSITQGEHTGEFAKLNTKLDHIVLLLERLIADEGTAG
jgi:hypothetical protein